MEGRAIDPDIAAKAILLHPCIKKMGRLHSTNAPQPCYGSLLLVIAQFSV
jgi:hypothetical protein